MFDHPIIDVALGLIFFYTVLSLVSTVVQEWVSSLFGLRSKNLRAGVKNFIGSEYADKIYKHPLIRNLSKKGKLPSYVSTKRLSFMLLEIIAKEKKGKSYSSCKADEVREIIDKIEEANPLREVLDALVNDGENAANNLESNLEKWFDEGMERISGWYKRKIQFWTIVIASFLTIATNSNSIHMAERLWKDDSLRMSIAVQAQNFEKAATNTSKVTEKEKTTDIQDKNSLVLLESFPIGWNHNLPESCFGWFILVLGWFVTIAAVSLGAPFWFDLLGKVSNLRGAGSNKSNTPNVNKKSEPT